MAVFLEPLKRTSKSLIKWRPEEVLNYAGLVAYSLTKNLIGQWQGRIYDHATDLDILLGKDYERRYRTGEYRRRRRPKTSIDTVACLAISAPHLRPLRLHMRDV